jgi:hypothetical protein
MVTIPVRTPQALFRQNLKIFQNVRDLRVPTWQQATKKESEPGHQTRAKKEAARLIIPPGKTH